MADKRPARPWKAYQSRRISCDQTDTVFGDDSLGVVCGAVSGNLEVLDFDKEGLVKQFIELARVVEGGLDVRRRGLPVISTPSGGAHVYYRSVVPVGGSQKLAVSVKPFVDRTGKSKICMIETRGEGGYVVAPPTPGYTVILGTLGNIPVLSKQEVEILHSVARSFDQVALSAPTVYSSSARDNEVRPGDAFNADKGTPTSELMISAGWEVITRTRECVHLRRPGKTKGSASATADYNDGGAFVFTTNDPLLPAGSHTKFGVFAQLYHGGDLGAAARVLAGRGYGDRRQSPSKAPPLNAVGGTAPQVFTVASRVTTGRSGGLMGKAQRREFLLHTKLKHTAFGAIEPSGVLPRGKTCMLVGEGGAGKSWWTIQLAVAVALGREFLGHDVSGVGRVVLASAEMSKEDMDDRLRYALTAAGLHSERERGDVLERIVRIPLQGVDVSFVRGDGDSTEVVEQFRSLVESNDFDLVILDPLSQFGGPGVEADPVIGNGLVRVLSSFSDGRNKPTVLIVHHTNKMSRGGVKTTSAAARGTSALTDGVRWQGNLETRERINGHPDFAVFWQTKSNDGPAIAPTYLVREDTVGGAFRVATFDEWSSYCDDVREQRKTQGN